MIFSLKSTAFMMLVKNKRKEGEKKKEKMEERERDKGNFERGKERL